MKSLQNQLEMRAVGGGLVSRGASTTAALAFDAPGSASASATTVTAHPQPLAPARWDWGGVRRVLVVRLRSIGDTVLATPALHALRRFLPDARIDVLLEDWVAPLLEGSTEVDRIVAVERGSNASRLRVVRELRAARYDVAYNLHGGTTATFLTRASGAARRVGYQSYRYSFLHTDAAPPASALWRQEKTHSVEQQLALLGWTGVPVSDRPPTRLAVTTQAADSITRKLREASARAIQDGGAGARPAGHVAFGDDDNGEPQSGNKRQPFALIHPAAAFESKTWAIENFARVLEDLPARGLSAVAVAAGDEAAILERLAGAARVPFLSLSGLTLPEVTALAARARLFVGNDSGIAHVAAATGTPSVVVFGSSNVAHWRPWTDAPAEVVREEMSCAPCPGYTCSQFDAPECIRRVKVESVTRAIERVLEQTAREN